MFLSSDTDPTQTHERRNNDDQRGFSNVFDSRVHPDIDANGLSGRIARRRGTGRELGRNQKTQRVIKVELKKYLIDNSIELTEKNGRISVGGYLDLVD